jgi:hypothetical protein
LRGKICADNLAQPACCKEELQLDWDSGVSIIEDDRMDNCWRHSQPGTR